jgi:hypothetical protein
MVTVMDVAAALVTLIVLLGTAAVFEHRIGHPGHVVTPRWPDESLRCGRCLAGLQALHWP